MSSAPHRQVLSGDPLQIPARTWNRLDAMSRAGDDATGRGIPRNRHSALVVLVKNESGAARNKTDILGIAGPIITRIENPAEFEFNFTLRGVTPADAHRGTFVVLQEPLAIDAIGYAVASGLCVARCEMADEISRFADVLPTDPTKLRSGGGSARLIHVEPEGEREVTGPHTTAWVIAQLGAGNEPFSVQVTAFATGFGVVTDSAVKAKFIREDGTVYGTEFDVNVLSYGDTAGQVGIVPLKDISSNPTTFPPIAVSDKIEVIWGTRFCVTQRRTAWFTHQSYGRARCS